MEGCACWRRARRHHKPLCPQCHSNTAYVSPQLALPHFCTIMKLCALTASSSRPYGSKKQCCRCQSVCATCLTMLRWIARTTWCCSCAGYIAMDVAAHGGNNGQRCSLSLGKSSLRGLLITPPLRACRVIMCAACAIRSVPSMKRGGSSCKISLTMCCSCHRTCRRHLAHKVLRPAVVHSMCDCRQQSSVACLCLSASLRPAEGCTCHCMILS